MPLSGARIYILAKKKKIKKRENKEKKEKK